MSIKKYKTKSGETRWAVNVYDKHLRKTLWIGTFRTPEDAKLAFAEADRRVRLGQLPVERKEVLFSALVDEWLELQTVNLRSSTKADYKYASRYLKQYFGNVPASSIEHSDVMRFVAWVSQKGLSDHYTRKMTTRLSQVFKFAEAMGYDTRRPCAQRASNLPQQPEKKIRPLTAAEIRALIEATPQHYRAAMAVMATCGTRRSETFGISRSSCDLEHGLIRVTHQLVDGQLAPLKTRRARRVIPVPTSTLNLLAAHLSTLAPNDLDLAFPTENGQPVRHENFRRRVWKPAVLKAGLRSDLTLHDLRRTYASALARQGRSAAFLQDVLGHQQASTTLAYYIGVYDEERTAATRDMDDWLAREIRTKRGRTYPCRHASP